MIPQRVAKDEFLQSLIVFVPIDVIGHVYQSETFDLYMLNANMIGQAFVYFVFIWITVWSVQYSWTVLLMVEVFNLCIYILNWREHEEFLSHQVQSFD